MSEYTRRFQVDLACICHYSFMRNEGSHMAGTDTISISILYKIWSSLSPLLKLCRTAWQNMQYQLSGIAPVFSGNLVTLWPEVTDRKNTLLNIQYKKYNIEEYCWLVHKVPVQHQWFLLYAWYFREIQSFPFPMCIKHRFSAIITLKMWRGGGGVDRFSEGDHNNCQ